MSLKGVSAAPKMKDDTQDAAEPPEMKDDTQDAAEPHDDSLHSSSSVFAQMSIISGHKVTRREAQYFVRKLWLIQFDDDEELCTEHSGPSTQHAQHESDQVTFETNISDDLSAAKDKGKRRQTEQDSCDALPPRKQKRDVSNERSAIDVSVQTGSDDVQDSDTDDPARATRLSLEEERETADAIRMSLGEDFESEVPARLQFSGPRNCMECAYLRKIPRDACKFRLVQSECPHFIAVSYCWPKKEDGSRKPTQQDYQYRKIVSRNESIPWNDNKPPDYVVRRAIEFARATDMRQIWIDQVCVNQDETARDHQLTIQGMDFVYRRAFASVGLLDSMLLDQKLLTAYAWALHCSENYTLPPNLGEVVENLMSLLDLIARDPFNQRAWVLQECISGSTCMRLALQKDTGIGFPSHPQPRVSQHIESSLIFEFNDVTELRELTQKLFNKLEMRDRSDARWYRVCAKLDLVGPRHPRYQDSSPNFRIMEGANYRSPPRITAALALTYLRVRKNHRISDRLAIMANICNYDVRLDTRKVAAFPSLAVAYMAQAFLNGDFSLCIPEFLKDPLQGTRSILNPLTSPGDEQGLQWDSGWCPHPTRSLPLIDSRYARVNNNLAIRNPVLYSISERGLRCPASIWKVDKQIDLRSVRDKWKTTWSSMKIVIAAGDFAPIEGEEELTHEVQQWAHIHEDALKSGLVEPPDRYKPFILIKLPPDIEERDRQGRYLKVCQILLDILRAVESLGYSSVATSIWMSLRRDQLPRSSRDAGTAKPMDFPDTAWEMLASPLIFRPTDLFQLDWEDWGSFYQAWIIERVMAEGFLWYGEAQPSFQGIRDDAQRLSSKTPDGDPGSSQEPTRSVTNSMRSTLPTAPQLPRTLIERQRVKRMFMQMLSVIDRRSDDWVLSPAAFATYALKSANGRQRNPMKHDLRGALAPFDVDGPATIAIPLDEELEILPHPPERSMCVCWSVEQVEVVRPEADLGDYIEETGGWGPLIRYKVIGKVKGCWPQMEFSPFARYEFI